MTRRDLARLAAGAAALFQRRPATAAAAQYTGALDGFESKVDMSSFDPVLYTLKAHDAAPLRLTFRATDRRQAEAWQKQLRPRIAELVGGFPAQRTALQPQTLEVRDYPGYRREKFVFESAPGVAVLGYLLTPKAGTAPFPAVVCVPGHGRGVDDIVGIDDKGQDRTVKVGYEYDYAIQVVEHGMAAVAIEPMACSWNRASVTTFFPSPPPVRVSSACGRCTKSSASPAIRRRKSSTALTVSPASSVCRFWRSIWGEAEFVRRATSRRPRALASWMATTRPRGARSQISGLKAHLF